MQIPSKKMQTMLIGAIMIFVIILLNSNFGEIGKKKEEGQTFSALEETLMNVEGIGELSIYFHYAGGNTADPLTDYFSLSNKSDKKGNQIEGVLVVAEGAEDFQIRSELSKILSTVLQLPEHRIVIVEMKKRGSHPHENE